MRLIDADALKRKSQKVATEAWKLRIKATVEVILNQFIDYIDAAPTIKPEPQWIPCSEMLPYAEYGESDNVIATCGYKDVEDGSIRWIRTLYFNGGNWCYPTGETYQEKVYAWMPLPELYQEGQDDSI